MTYAQGVKRFKFEYIHLYINKVDYWKAEEAWAKYIDNLCKDGEITQNQYETWQTPFPYGKNLKPSYKQLAIAYGD